MRKFTTKTTSVFLIFVMVFEILTPTISFALTDGPSQPESQGFKSIANSDMVNIFSGDFSYNIPLMEVGGYPINLTYQSNPTMEQEASWVGLGWNVNPGAITRNLRGLPDDFKEEKVKKEYNVKPNVTVGVDYVQSLEILGMNVPKNMFNASIGVFYNNYKGVGLTLGFGATTGAGGIGKGDLTSNLGLGIDMKTNTQEGITVSPSVGYKYTDDKLAHEGRVGASASFSSRSGIQDLSFTNQVNYSSNKESTSKDDNPYDESQSSSSSISFINQSYSPAVNMPMKSLNFALNIKFGSEVFFINPNSGIRGFYNEYSLKDKSLDLKAYGYINEEAGRDKSEASLDFIREKDGPFTAQCPNLPIPMHTYDIFNVSGEGIGGQFRAHRGDIGMLHDAESGSTSVSADFGGELGAGNIFKAGWNVNAVLALSKTTKWDKDNDLYRKISFEPNNPLSTSNYESSYFKMIGECVGNTTFKNAIYNDLIISAKLNNGLVGGGVNGIINKYNVGNNFVGDHAPATKILRGEREPRNTLIQSFTVADVDILGGIHWLKDKPLLSKSSFLPSALAYGQGGRGEVGYPVTNRPDHQIAEMVITKSDGKRYYYGIPVYNNMQKEVSFSLDNVSNPNKGQVLYNISNPNPDNSTRNKKGFENYYNSITTPGYAHSYLLTAIVSPDYVDRLNDGPTNDDIGTWVKFNYTKLHDNYRWRIPFLEKTATFNEGFYNNNGDDKASYIYGEKEVWILHSVESKSQIAVFITDSRNDGFGVRGENGGIDIAMNQVKLSRISLYSKSSLNTIGVTPIAIKTVYFDQDYELCKGIDNNKNGSAEGKLTLKSIWFTYGNSTRGKLNSYVFSYANNPTYNIQNVDRWGNYADYSLIGSTNPNNTNFPYVTQNKSKADDFSGAWSLSTINLPSGGVINVNYEADDYAYVQNKQACQMFFIRKMGNTKDYSSANNETYASKDKPHNFLFIEVPQAVNSKQDILNKYLKGLEFLYYRVYLKLAPNKPEEYVSGYGEILDYHYNSAYPNIICIEIQTQKVNSFYVNPIAKASWQLMRQQLPDLIYPYGNNTNFDPVKLVKALVGSLGEIVSFFKSFDKTAINKEFAKKFDGGYSIVRLNNPNFKKLGGGSRVKDITIMDNWYTMTGNSESEKSYKTSYSYTKKEKINGVEREISSGVASYEPITGNDENPFRIPIKYGVGKNVFSKGYETFVEEPLGESFFPSPTVGYSRVEVKSVNTIDPTLSLGVGKEVYEYYTSKDFPTIVARTPIQSSPFVPKAFFTFIKILKVDLQNVSQGYYIETNDMHGKLKSQITFNEANKEIAGTRHFYKETTNAQGVRKLESNVKVISNKNSILSKEIGADYDLSVDMRKQTSNVIGLGLQSNSETTVIPLAFVPLVISLPLIFPSGHFDITRYRSSSMVKYVNRSGIIDRVETIKDGSLIVQKNELYDEVTGDVVLTSVKDEYNNDIYDFKYPAWWIYEKLAPAFNTSGVVVNIENSITKGLIPSNSSNYSFLEDGDELMPLTPTDYSNLINELYNQPGIRPKNDARFWVSKPNPQGNIYLIDDNGNPLNYSIPANSSISFKIIRTGNKNMQSIIAGNINSINNNPIHNNSIDFNGLEILNTAATTYKDDWQINCESRGILECELSIDEWPCFTYFLRGLLNINNSYVGKNPGFNIFYDKPSAPISVSKILQAGKAQSGCFQIELGGNNVNDIDFLPLVSGNAIVNPFVAKLGECWMIIRRKDGGDINLNDFYSSNLKNDLISDVAGDNYNLTNFILNDVIELEANFYCQDCKQNCNYISEIDASFNPYLEGVKNNWHPEKNWAYQGIREANVSGNDYIAKKSGKFVDLSTSVIPFKVVGANTSAKFVPNLVYNGSKWISTSTTTKIHQAGEEVENFNALNIYNTALYGYNNEVPIAVSKNAEYRELYFSSYEDINYNKLGDCKGVRWKQEPALDVVSPRLTSRISHTGNHSIFIGSDDSYIYEGTFYEANGDENYDFDHINNLFKKTGNTCIPLVSLDKGKKYIASAWIHNDGCDIPQYDLGNSKIEFFNGGSSSGVYLFATSSLIIDGWQKIEVVFETPNDFTNFFVNFNFGVDTHIDDFKISPLNSETKAYVYDPITLRLMANLDQNNYATFFEYDEEGQLVRTKKETERGIMTIKENRKNLMNR